MKKSGILNSGVMGAIAGLRHGDLLVISDAGLPVPESVRVIDLAIEKDFPDVVRILELITEEFLYERVVVASEQRENNPLLYSKISSVVRNCDVSLEPHGDILMNLLPKAKYVIRTGSFEPWGNILLYSGLNAPLWFAKGGVKTPPAYRAIIDRFEGD